MGKIYSLHNFKNKNLTVCMFSTFHARISERFVKWITPPSLPPPPTKTLYFTTARKGSWESMTNLECPGIWGCVLSTKEELGWPSEQESTLMLASLQESKAPPLSFCPLCPPPQGPQNFFPLTLKVRCSVYLVSCEESSEKWWERRRSTEETGSENHVLGGQTNQTFMWSW